MKKITSEDIVNAALTMERWCLEHYGYPCDCPFLEKRISDGAYKCRLINWRILHSDFDE